MTDFAVTIGDLLCTPLDVRIKSELVMKELASAPEESLVTIDDGRVESHIIHASGLVIGALEGFYGGVSALKVSAPYVNRPQRNKNNKTLIRLDKVAISNLAVTELWTIKMLTPTASDHTIRFSLEGSVSGSQGTGDNKDTTTDYFTSTNDHIRIANSYWTRPNTTESSEVGDEIYFCTYLAKPMIVYITSCLAAGELLNSLTSETSPNQSSLGSKLIKEANDWLKMLCDPKSGITLASAPSVAIDWIAVSNRPADVLGEDTTEYSESLEDGREDDDAIGFRS